MGIITQVQNVVKMPIVIEIYTAQAMIVGPMVYANALKGALVSDV